MNANRILSHNSPITVEHKHSEATLCEKEDVFRRLAEFSPGILAIIREEHFVYINPAGAEILGAANSNELFGKSPREIMPAADSDFLLEQIRYVLDEDRLHKFEHSLESKKTKVWFDSSISPMSHNSVVWTAHDVTRYKEAEQTLEQNEAQLEQSQKIESIGKWAGGIAHDFNNMLTVINGYSELSLRRLKKDGPLRSNIEEIKKAGERSELLTYQLLAFSRQQILKPEIVNLNEIIGEVSSMLQRLLTNDIQLNMRLNKKLGYIKADSGQISHLVLNLVSYVKDSMPRGGTLTIETENFIFDKKFEEFIGRQNPVKPGTYIKLNISGLSSGINKSARQNIFEPFYSGKSIGLGNASGLSSAYDIVKQASGYIFADGKAGKGITLRVYLPQINGKIEFFKRKKHSSKFQNKSKLY